MIYSYVIPAGGYALNGNIQAHSDSVMGDWAFMYDTLNRLVVGGAAANPSAPYPNSMSCWGYDSFGNRTLAAFLSTTTGDCSQQTTPTASYNASNQITFVGQGAPISYSAPSGFTYDNAGNVTTDGVNSYAYDSEGRLCAVQQPSVNGGGLYRYIYDASGLRVAKATFTGTFPARNTVCPAAVPGTNVTLTGLYLLNRGGEQVTELNGTGGWVHSNVWAGSHLDATYDTKGLHFQLADPLGTRRVQTNYQGVVEETFQSLPFGDNLTPVSTGLSTSDDATEHHFTGKERDGESGNDYFPARYYASSMGRWMSPDPIPWLGWQNPPEGSSEEEEEESHKKFEEWISDPQNFNMYSYVNNNPLNHTDPSGMAGCTAGGKTYSTCTITITYDPKTSHGTLTVTGMNKGDKNPTELLKGSVVVGGMVDGKLHVTPTGTFHASYWQPNQTSTKYGNEANTKWSDSPLGINAFGPFSLHIKELDSQGIEIHGTMGPSWNHTTWGNSIFMSAASHGCVRMCTADDITLHSIMPNPSGNKIIIGTTP
jgi:RHS repeat-associated protein